MFSYVDPATGARFRPMGDRVVIRPDKAPTKVGRILLPESVRLRMVHREIHTGVVLAMGPGMPTIRGGRWPMPDIQQGARVYYYPEGSVRFQLFGEEVLSLRDDFVLAECLKDASFLNLYNAEAV